MIRESVQDVQKTLILGGLLTDPHRLLFLNSWRSTVITGLTLPISVISSFIVMYFLGMTLNMMTLMALSLAIGMLIDDAIVVRENIVRHLERGEDHFTAARKGTAEIGLAVLATTLSIIAVFVPVAFMKGIVGRFFYQFGITVAFAVLVSLFVSFTLDPMLSSRWYDPDIERKGRREPRRARCSTASTPGSTAWPTVPRRDRLGAGPPQDGARRRRRRLRRRPRRSSAACRPSSCPTSTRANSRSSFKTAPDASIAETAGRLEAVLAALKGCPEVEHTYATIGAGDTGTVRDASIYVKLVDARARRTRSREIQRDLRPAAGGPRHHPVGRRARRPRWPQKPLRSASAARRSPTAQGYAAELKESSTGVPGIVDLEMSPGAATCPSTACWWTASARPTRAS